MRQCPYSLYSYLVKVPIKNNLLQILLLPQNMYKYKDFKIFFTKHLHNHIYLKTFTKSMCIPLQSIVLYKMYYYYCHRYHRHSLALNQHTNSYV